MSQQLERCRRARSGIPALSDPSRPWWRRLLTDRRTWVTVGLLIFYTFCLFDQYFLLSPDRPIADGKVALGLNNEALQQATLWAIPTLLVWMAVFIWLDRWRPQRLLIWAWMVGWGGSVATWISIYINSWAGEMMAVQGQAVDTGARPAIFIAPFVEEAAKATVLFFVAMLMRYRLVNKLNIVALAGMSAVGFAFTENIIYYARALVYASNTIEVTDPSAAVSGLVLLRGVFTSFGHPLFTSMTAMGVAVGLRARSKIVRVLMPLAGYLAAAAGHMLFNGIASNSSGGLLLTPYPIIAVIFVYLAFLFYGSRREGTLVRARLTDFVTMGWLDSRDPVVFSGLSRRLKLLVASVFRGKKVLVATFRFVRRITELAYLRDATVRGLIDHAGIEREKELLQELRELRAVALTETEGLKTFIWPFRRRRRRVLASPPNYPGPAGIGGQWPIPR